MTEDLELESLHIDSVSLYFRSSILVYSRNESRFFEMANIVDVAWRDPDFSPSEDFNSLCE